MAQLNFRNTTGTLAEDYEVKPSPVTGTIKEVIAHFPPGCNALVEIKVFQGMTQILPDKGSVALDDATQPFSIMRSINLGDPIRVDWINHDDTYTHTTSVVVSIEEKPIGLI